jgi:hypothetical protein
MVSIMKSRRSSAADGRREGEETSLHGRILLLTRDREVVNVSPKPAGELRVSSR